MEEKMKRLTDVAVERMPIPPKGHRPREVFDSVATGLGLKITPAGRRIWFAWLRYPGHKYQTARTLGVFPAMKVAEARIKAGRWYELVKQGIDPEQAEAEARSKIEIARRAEAAKQNCTFAVYAEQYIAQKTNRRRAADAGEIRHMLIPALGPMPLHLITPRDARELMIKLQARAPYSALNGWTHLTQIMKSATHDELIPVSPLASLDKKLVFRGTNTGARQRVLNDEEVFAFWRAAGKLDYPAGPFYRLLLLTGVRLRELLEARWEEFHPELQRRMREASSTGRQVDWSSVANDVKILTIPRARFKSDAEHLAPLSNDACGILESLPRFAGCDYLFTANGQTPVWASSKMKRRVDDGMLLTLRALARSRGDDPAQVKLPGFVIHDLRRVVRTNLSALDVPDHVAEMVIGHGRRGLQRIYDRHTYAKHIRDALERWASRLREIVTRTEPRAVAHNVMPLRKAG
jgi:integrase